MARAKNTEPKVEKPEAQKPVAVEAEKLDTAPEIKEKQKAEHTSGMSGHNKFNKFNKFKK